MQSSKNIPEIDVRQLPPANRQPAIFGVLAALAPGGAMHVTADHDPRPLQYQIVARFPDMFDWEYVAQGPEVWRVQITRLDSSGCGCSCGH